MPLPVAVLFIAPCLLAGCAQPTPQFDATFGDSVRTAVAQQTLNPDASRNNDPVSGIDGRAAQEAMNRYQKSFAEKEPPRSDVTINISGGR
ncbi:pilus assembly protein [Noviherbaspirillum saxi]|uniref:Pilus assembly protein n=1 Tax=Noviherbaspirillum saxi TaxID=2320863 RepID=A0A3A3G0H9_9BURK|nr:pilus assembly protein [Noviherbaspirillum saxi]RJF92839.1 pilus assembly protein [Noviherbaspirillum saxi]